MLEVLHIGKFEYCTVLIESLVSTLRSAEFLRHLSKYHFAYAMDLMLRALLYYIQNKEYPDSVAA